MAFTGFSNESIRAPTDKPHICKRQGWWRVSSMKGIQSPLGRARFSAAHRFIRQTNEREHMRINDE